MLTTRDNDDQTAKKFKAVNDELDFARELTISWNIIPWKATTTHKNNEADGALHWLGELIDLLDSLAVVVLFGTVAQRATFYLYEKYPELSVIHSPHPARRGMRNGGEQRLRSALRKARMESTDRLS